MLTQAQYERCARTLPILRQADQALQREFMQAAGYARIPAGSDVFFEGADVDAIALLLAGVVRVYKIGATGREITLYRFGLGESCILSANAILSRQSFPALATVEQDAEAVLIPAAIFRGWVDQYPLWRRFVFDLLAQRLASVMEIVDEVAFRRLDARVAALLLERSRSANPIQITHHEIAAELGSSREVITRLLADFADAHLIRLARGAIEIIDAAALQQRTAM